MQRLPALVVAFVTGFGFILAFKAVTSAQATVLPTPRSVPTPVATPDTPLTVVAQITNETPGGTLPITTTVYLLGFDSRGLVLRTTAVADATGSVSFENVENAPGRSFGLAATVGRTAYSSQPQAPEPGAGELVLTLKTYGTTTDASPVSVAQAYVLGEFLNDREVQIINAYILSNLGDRTVEGGQQTPDGRIATLRFPLPKGATDVKLQERSADEFILTEDGVMTTWGIPPGDRTGRVIVTYSLPYTGQLHYESRNLYPIQAVQVSFVDQGVAPVSSQLTEQETFQREDGATVRSFTGGAIAAGEPLAFDLRGAPKVEPDIAGSAPTESSGAPVVSLLPRSDNRLRIAVGIVAFGLILLVVSAAWWGWARRRDKKREQPGGSPEHEVLVRALASLDDAYEAGEIAEEDYVQHRRFIKGALVSALEPAAASVRTSNVSLVGGQNE